MKTEQKANLISAIIAKLRFMASSEKKDFDTGDVFFSLAFKTDAELKNIAKLCGI